MVPTTWPALLVLAVAVLPGAMFTFGFERQAGAFGATLADRVLRFVAVSAGFDLLYAWPAFLLYRHGIGPPPWPPAEFALTWAAVLAGLAVPGVAGAVAGGLYATRTARTRWRWVRGLLSERREAQLLRLVVGRRPAPRAWDHFFSERPTAYLRVRTTDGQWIGGRFAERSYAAGYPQEPDLLIEEAWPISADGTFGDAPLGYPVFIASGTIAYVEIVPESADEEVAAGVG